MDSCPSTPRQCTERWPETHILVCLCGWELVSSCEWGSSSEVEGSCSSSPPPCTHTWYPSQPVQPSPSFQTCLARNPVELPRAPLSERQKQANGPGVKDKLNNESNGVICVIMCVCVCVCIEVVFRCRQSEDPSPIPAIY